MVKVTYNFNVFTV